MFRLAILAVLLGVVAWWIIKRSRRHTHDHPAGSPTVPEPDAHGGADGSP